MMGYSKEDADRLRARGYSIVACFFCLHESKQEPYYEITQTNMIGPLIACPDHWDSDGFGKVEVGDWLGP